MSKSDPIAEPARRANSQFRCGTAALAGRSNVGKSTLLNRLLGLKVAIVAEKPQATRSRVLGIQNVPGAQLIWIDLPGIHRPRGLLNHRIVETARRSISEADVVVVVVDAEAGFGPGDAEVTEIAAARGQPWLVALNKIDLRRRSELMPLLAGVGERYPQTDLVPVSAVTGENLAELEREVVRRLPSGPALYPDDDFTDQTPRKIVEEFVREKIFETTAAEIPYCSAVVVDTYIEKAQPSVNVVAATILVERESQRRILIGQGGAMIREIGKRARLELEALFGKRFFLELFVKVRHDWTKNRRALDDLGL